MFSKRIVAWNANCRTRTQASNAAILKYLTSLENPYRMKHQLSRLQTFYCAVEFLLSSPFRDVDRDCAAVAGKVNFALPYHTPTLLVCATGKGTLI